jgi:addiction module HigA family antidote
MSTYKVLNRKGEQIETDVTLHPGEVLKNELEARGIQQKDFAKKLGIQPPHLNDLLKGKRQMSARLAVKIEKELDIDAAFWLRVQSDYYITMIRRELKDA